MPQGPLLERSRPSSRQTVALAYALILVVAVVRVWTGRYSMNPDGICYLDLGDAFFQHKWSQVVNGYWSPLYAYLLGLALFIVKPGRWWEFPTAHVVNFILFLFSLAGFEFLLRTLRQDLRTNARDENVQGLTEPSLLALSYAIFLWTSLELITIWDIAPDMCLAAFIYLAAGLLLRIRRRFSVPLSIAMGVVLGLAYLTKAIMFPLGLVFILIGLSCIQRQARARYLFSVTITFLVISGPWLVALSHAKGRLDFGDSGRLAYSAYVAPGGRLLNWQGQPPGSGVPLHTTRRIFENPPVYEFSSPVGGTYPPSYDPSYWNEGRKWKFDVRAQATVILAGLFTYANLMFRDQSGLAAGTLALILAGGVATRNAILKNWPLLAMCFVAMGLYLLVLVESRYVAAYMGVLWLIIIFGVRLTTEQLRIAQYLVLSVVVTILISIAYSTGHGLRSGDPGIPAYSAANQISIADALEKMGVKAGDRIAVAGDGNWAYWARAGKLKIVSTIMSPDLPAFWSAGPDQRENIYHLFYSTGAKAVVSMSPPVAGEHWEKIGDSDFYVRVLE
jgi:hypothetical protein